MPIALFDAWIVVQSWPAPSAVQPPQLWMSLFALLSQYALVVSQFCHGAMQVPTTHPLAPQT
jgi:hypothetical protein